MSSTCARGARLDQVVGGHEGQDVVDGRHDLRGARRGVHVAGMHGCRRAAAGCACAGHCSVLGLLRLRARAPWPQPPAPRTMLTTQHILCGCASRGWCQAQAVRALCAACTRRVGALRAAAPARAHHSTVRRASVEHIVPPAGPQREVGALAARGGLCGQRLRGCGGAEALHAVSRPASAWDGPSVRSIETSILEAPCPCGLCAAARRSSGAPSVNPARCRSQSHLLLPPPTPLADPRPGRHPLSRQALHLARGVAP